MNNIEVHLGLSNFFYGLYQIGLTQNCHGYHLSLSKFDLPTPPILIFSSSLNGLQAPKFEVCFCMIIYKTSFYCKMVISVS